MRIFLSFADWGGRALGESRTAPNMNREISMSTFDIDESLSNILHAIAAIPFGLGFVVLIAAQFLAHAA